MLGRQITKQKEKKMKVSYIDKRQTHLFERSPDPLRVLVADLGAEITEQVFVVPHGVLKTLHVSGHGIDNVLVQNVQ